MVQADRPVQVNAGADVRRLGHAAVSAKQPPRSATGDRKPAMSSRPGVPAAIAGDHVNVSVNMNGVNTLRLVVAGGPDGNGSDHGDWADAQVTCN